jgi:hypothetical protein
MALVDGGDLAVRVIKRNSRPREDSRMPTPE